MGVARFFQGWKNRAFYCKPLANVTETGTLIVMKKRLIFLLIPAVFGITSCSNMSPDANARLALVGERILTASEAAAIARIEKGLLPSNQK